MKCTLQYFNTSANGYKMEIHADAGGVGLTFLENVIGQIFKRNSKAVSITLHSLTNLMI